MQIQDLDQFFQELLDLPRYVRADASMNGLQVGRKAPEIRKVAFAVDACVESFERAADAGADLLFVHHGLFWGQPLSVTGGHYDRIRTLLDRDLGLYAAHLPLDLHPVLGNNAQIARRMGLQEIEPFGEYKGLILGFKGRFNEPRTAEEVLALMDLDHQDAVRILPFGSEKMETLGIVSGGAPFDVLQAIDQNLDGYVTGDASHSVYHQCLEAKINMISAGHYNTEIWGVKALAEHLHKETGLETLFIDVPTGL